MGLINFNFFSNSLGMQADVNVVLPIGANVTTPEGGFRCLWLLHGYGDDNTNWVRWSSIERYASEYNICVIMPAGGHSYYTDMKYGEKYYTYIAKELPAAIHNMLPVSDKREDNFICGLSMGGYGALKIALKENDHFCAVAGLSAVTEMRERSKRPFLFPVFGEQGMTDDSDDLYWLVKEKQNEKNKPRFFMGCGTEDDLLDECRDFTKALVDAGYDVTEKESAGEHSWVFWDEYIQYVLKWMFG